MKDELLKKIEARECLVGVVGLGYVGLPLVREFARGGARILGFDIDRNKVDVLQRGESYIGHIPSETISDLVRSGQFEPTSDFERLCEPDCILIAVPTPLDRMRQPDLSFVETTAREISKRLKKGQLIVLESTTYPGTTNEVILPILESSGLRAGEDFFLAYSPEREDPGREDFTTRTIPKVVGGLDANSLEVASSLYKIAIDEVVPVSSCEAAETSKILENTFRCVNIALVNELKILMDKMDIDIWEVIEAAKTKPFGFMPFYPGPGLGGHCIPIDPFYLSWKARQYNVNTRFIELAGEVNCSMPEYVINRLADALNDRSKSVKGSRILVLGLAYKKDVDDVRESPSLELIEQLASMGAKVDYNDPHCASTHKMREYDLQMESRELSGPMLESYDAVLISTDHTAYDFEFIVERSQLVIDTRNATQNVKQGREKIVKA